MESGKRTIGVVGLVAAMVVLQLAVAPMAMARSPQHMKPDGSVLLVTENGTEVRGIPCGESCVWIPCLIPGCDCVNKLCYINFPAGKVLPSASTR
jgi:hypothetical protein